LKREVFLLLSEKCRIILSFMHPSLLGDSQVKGAKVSTFVAELDLLHRQAALRRYSQRRQHWNGSGAVITDAAPVAAIAVLVMAD
jgi:hypothetical protein